MMKMSFSAFIFAASTCWAALIAWIFWGPVLHMLFALIPDSAAYAWAGKLVAVVIIGYFGGVAIPAIIFLLGIAFAVAVYK